MPTTKHELLDWLLDVPEDAEIGTDGQGLALLAILGTNVHLLELDKNEPPLAILLAYARLVEIPVEQIIDDEIELTI